MPIQIAYQYTTKGAEDVKKRLQDLNAEYVKGKMSVEKYGKGLREIDKDARQLNRTQNISKNLYLAMHPNLNKLSRSISVFGSVMRTTLTIANALNIANLASSGISAERARADAEVSQAQRELALAIKKYGEDSIEAAEAQDKLNVALANQQELMTSEKNQKFNDFITLVSSLGTALATSIGLITNNPKLSTAVWNAASKLGGLFGGIFTGVSTAIMAAGNWITTSLGIGSKVYSKSATAGLQAGTTFGLSFVGGIAAGIVAAAGAVSIVDLIQEKLFGHSTLKEIQKKLGVENPQSAADIFGIPNTGPAFFDPLNRKTTNSKGEIVPEKTAGSIVAAEEIKKQLAIFQPLVDLFENILPKAYGETDEKFDEVFATNIPSVLASAAPTVREGFKNMWNGVIELTNAAGSAMVTATNSIFQSLINALNSMINSYNNAARKIGKSTVGKVTFSPISYTPIPTIAAANGFDGIVNQPTNFLVGEGGRPEHVAVTPLGKNSPNSGLTVINSIHVQGSILAEREIYKLQDKYLKDSLLKVGFRKSITH